MWIECRYGIDRRGMTSTQYEGDAAPNQPSRPTGSKPGRERGSVVDEWRYHPIRVRLARNCTYEPDFGVWDKDGLLTLCEVKGSWLAKNARDSRTRLIIAASMFHRWAWLAVTRESGIWRFERMSLTEGVPMD